MSEQSEGGTDREYVWLAQIEQDYGDPVIIPARSRFVAEEHAEDFVEQRYGELLGEWHGNPSKSDESIMAYNDNRKAIVSKQRIRTEAEGL